MGRGEEKLRINSGLEAKTLFEDLQRRYPGRFGDGQLRTLQRRVKIWRALEGPPREVYFPQVHKPGELCQSDFTSMNSLGVRIQRQPFEHLLYHFVLTYSNWETGTICYSESFESLSEGLQNALWELGGVPERHRTDRLSAAVQKPDQPEEFTQRMLAYYVEWHMRKALAPLLFDDEELDGNRKKRDPVKPAQPSASAKKKKNLRFTSEGLVVQSFDTLLMELGTRCRNRCRVNLNIAKNWVKRTWVNRSERVRGEPSGIWAHTYRTHTGIHLG